jgi:disulfide oxidoreductase YuzD
MMKEFIEWLDAAVRNSRRFRVDDFDAGYLQAYEEVAAQAKVVWARMKSQMENDE